MSFLDESGKLLEMGLKFGYGLSHEFSETRLYQIQKLLPEPGLTTATLHTECQRNPFQSG